MKYFNLRSTLTTGTYRIDENEGWVDLFTKEGVWFGEYDERTACKGDGGTSLMVKQHERWVKISTSQGWASGGKKVLSPIFHCKILISSHRHLQIICYCRQTRYTDSAVVFTLLPAVAWVLKSQFAPGYMHYNICFEEVSGKI